MIAEKNTEKNTEKIIEKISEKDQQKRKKVTGEKNPDLLSFFCLTGEDFMYIMIAYNQIAQN